MKLKRKNMSPKTVQRSSAKTNTNRVWQSNKSSSRWRPSPRSEETERFSTYRTLAWFSGPAMLRVTRARWITIDSRQNRTECHYEDLFRYLNEHVINAWLIVLHICKH